MRVTPLFFLLLSAFALVANPLSAQAAAGSTAAELHAAARDGDVERVKALLDAGVDVNAPSRYEATALSFAAEKGHVEVVRLLLERGADPSVRDTFYQQTPLAWSLGNLEIVELLLTNGAKDHAQAVIGGLQRDDAKLVAAGVAAGPLKPWELSAARAMAEGKEEMEKLLAGAKVQADYPTVEVPEERLGYYAGTYRIANGSREIHFEVREGALWVREEGETDARRLFADAATHFRVVDDTDLGYVFAGRSGMVERLVRLHVAAQEIYEVVATDEIAEVPKKKRPLFAPKDDPPEDEAPKAATLVEREPRTAPIHWPSFRGGVRATGIGDGQGIVAQWDTESGENVRWKAAVPGLGLSSPIVWGDRIFLTTAVSAKGDRSLKTGLYGDFETADDDSEHTWQVLALDAATGKTLWTSTAGKAVPKTKRHTKASQANSTPATDGEYVVAVFPTLGLFCYTVDGELVWHHDLGVLDAGWFYDPSYQWGFANSPIVWDGKVILQTDVQEGAFVAAWDLATGEEVWRTERDEIPTWATPSLHLSGERPELILNGTTIRGYDPRDGSELWSLAPNSEVIIAAPVVTDELIYVSAGYPPVRAIYAVRPGGEGDISPVDDETTSDHVAWSYARGGAYMPTPIVYRGVFYIGHHNGRLAAYDAKTGEQVYRARFSGGGTFTGSPVAGDGMLFFPTEDGRVYVVEAGRKYEEIAVHEMGEPLLTTPAISDGTMYLRTAEHLWAIGAGE